MMDLWSVVRADLSIADLIRPAEGFGPHNTIPRDFGCVVAGKDPVAVDATACRMVGLDITKVSYFKSARQRGIGNFGEKSIEIRGRTIKEVFTQLWFPYLGGLEQWPEYHIYPKGGCSSCLGLLAFTLEKLKSMGEYEKNAGISIVVGPKRELPQGVDHKDLILYGDCVRRHREQGVFIEGCPPAESVSPWSIINRIDSEKKIRAPRTMESEAAYTKPFIEHAKKLKEKADSVT
jgi:hypothetical protein